MLRVYRIFFSKTNDLLSFLWMEGVGVTKLVILCGRHKYTIPKWLKIITNSIFKGSSFLFNIKPATFWLHREQTPALPPQSPRIFPPLLHWWPKQSTCYFQLPLIFYVKKYCGLINIASWLASNWSFEQESVTDI